MEKFFDSLSQEMQLILVVVGIAILLLAVFANNKRNQGKLRERKRKSFKQSYNERKQNENT